MKKYVCCSSAPKIITGKPGRLKARRPRRLLQAGLGVSRHEVSALRLKRIAAYSPLSGQSADEFRFEKRFRNFETLLVSPRRRISQTILIALLLGAIGASSLCFAQSPIVRKVVPPAYQRISLDLKGVDILDVLKLFSQKSGLNFVAGRNVTGRVTIFVKDVNVWDAFELIVGANDLAYEKHGDIVTVMTARDYELLYGQKFQERKKSLIVPLRYAKVVQVATVLNQIKSAVGRVVADETSNTLVVNDVPERLAEMRNLIDNLDRPIKTRIYQLNYAKAQELKDKAQELLSPVGTFTFDERTNAAVVSDLPEVLAKIDPMVSAFDIPDQQVLIEAKILTVTLNKDMSLGVDWNAIFSGIDSNAKATFDSVSGDVAGGTATGGAFRILSSTTGASLVIEALEQLTKTETLASPHIRVSNNEEAKILVGTKEAFITTTTTVPATGSTVASSEVEFVDVGTKLFVTPSIKRDGYIQLQIRPEVSSTTDTVTTEEGNRIPIVTTTEAETMVLVKSGVTVIIGGLIDVDKSHTKNSIPILGDIPVIGRAFQGITHSNDKKEIVVFMTPNIVMPDGSPYVPPEAAPKQLAAPTIASVVIHDPVPAAYRKVVRERLRKELARQFRAQHLGAGSVTVSFVMNHRGQVMGTPEVTSPEGDAFIQAAQAALSEVESFPPFPEGASSSDVKFKLAVDYVP